MSEPRRHHIVPASYLRRFAVTGNPNQICVYDKDRGASYKTSVNNAAVVRDYYKVDTDGTVDPYTLEKGLSVLEGSAIPVIKKITRGEEVSNEERAYVAEFISVQHLRGQNMLKFVADTTALINAKMLDVTLASKDRWEQQTKQMQEKGYLLEDDISYEDLKKFHENREYEVSFNHQWLLGQSLTQTHIEPYTQIFFDMHWTVLEAAPGHFFYTSDTPLIYSSPEMHPIYGDGGLMHKNIEVTFPLSKKYMLLASWQGFSERHMVKDTLCKKMNANTAKQAYQYVYGPKNDPVIMGIAVNSKKGSRRLKSDDLPEVKIRRPSK